MARITEEEVLTRMGNPASLSVSDVTPFIELATVMVDTYLVGYVDSDTLLSIIECLLAAHFLSLNLEKEVKSEGVEGITQSFRGQTGKGLEFTTYGQSAILYDTSFRLKRLSEGKLKTGVSIGSLTSIGRDRTYL